MMLKDCNVFVTGGVGFIGSHTCLSLLEHGCKVTIIDNLANSFERVFEHMVALAGDAAPRMRFVKCDLLDRPLMTKLFTAEKFDAVVHFAGFKAVGESVDKPVDYYENNFAGTINLLRAMDAGNCRTLVFSSSCTVYGMPDKSPITEDTALGAINPYGRTKLFQEEMFRDLAVSDPRWRILLLRYFNPVGAHPSGTIGEHPVGIPNNLMPYVQQVALGQRDFLRVWGGDYPTPDGTAIRDYIHVMDLAEGHVFAVAKVTATADYGCRAVNLGTGTGTSVLEMVAAFKAACGKDVPYKIMERRAGDSVAVWAATELAQKELGWKAKYDVHAMCVDQWRWATMFPQGYDTPRK